MAMGVMTRLEDLNTVSVLLSWSQIEIVFFLAERERERKWQDAEENHIMRSFVICTLRQILLGWVNLSKLGGIRWVGHVTCVGNMKTACSREEVT
jgi:hypothetical protein